MTSDSVKLTLSGEGSIDQAPDRGIVNITVESKGADRATVSDEVQQTVKKIHAMILPMAARDANGQLEPGSAVTRWSSGSMMTRTYSETYWEPAPAEPPEPPLDDSTRPGPTRTVIYHEYTQRGPDGRPARQKTRLIFSVSVPMKVRFRDFAGLGDFTLELASEPLVNVGQVDWALTDETEKALKTEVIKRAYADVFAKAKAYADAMGLKTVRPVQVEESNEAEARRKTYTRSTVLFGNSASTANQNGGQDLRLMPHDIKYDAYCRVIFEVK